MFFQFVSQAKIDICAGLIDGILIWIAKLSSKQAEKAEINQGKFLCGRKGKFGLNYQAVLDVWEEFWTFQLGHGGLSSDYLVFERSKFFERCEADLMKNGKVLFDDNAYLNIQYMATPYTNVSGNKEHVTKPTLIFFIHSWESELNSVFVCLFSVGGYFKWLYITQCPYLG